MSASPQVKVPFSYSTRPVLELELMRLIGNITWTSSREDQAFASIAALIVRLPGFLGFRFEPFGKLPHLPAYETSKARGNGPDSHARAPVSAHGRVWGDLRLFFDPNAALTVESPVRLVRFIGQQIALMLARLAIQRERRGLLARLDQIRHVIRRRKLVHSAAAILARQRNISGADAIRLLAGYARRNRRRLSDISEALILGCNPAILTRPVFRRAIFEPSLAHLPNPSRLHELPNSFPG